MRTLAMTASERPDETPAWRPFQVHHAKIKDAHLCALFAEDPRRGERFAIEGAGFYLDYSKNRVTAETIRLLLQLADERSVLQWRDAMFRGEQINITER